MSNRKKSALITRVLALCLVAAVFSGCSKEPKAAQVNTDPAQATQPTTATSPPPPPPPPPLPPNPPHPRHPPTF